jgi:hypothetical protein
MRWRTFFLALCFAATLAAPAPAGWLFGKSSKAKSAERVPQLLAVLKSDPDGGKREQAAEELRQFDGNAFPEIAPALIEALLQDTRTEVRAEAAESLARLRPVSQAAGQALDQAANHDGSMRVRLLARRWLLQYRLSGFHGKGKVEEPAGPSLTPPPPAAAPATVEKERLTPAPRARLPLLPSGETIAPPLAGPSDEAPKAGPAPAVRPAAAPVLLPPTIRTGEGTIR